MVNVPKEVARLERRMPILGEFREFIARGNVIDLAVGVIIGAAFNDIVKSLVDGVAMPPVGLLLSGVDFSHLEWVLKPDNPATKANELVAIQYGLFLNIHPQDLHEDAILGVEPQFVAQSLDSFESMVRRLRHLEATPKQPQTPHRRGKLVLLRP